MGRLRRCLGVCLVLGVAVLGLAGASAQAKTVGANCVKPLNLQANGQDLSNCNLNEAMIGGFAALQGSNLTGAKLNEATISGVDALKDANLTGARLEGAKVTSGIGALEGATYSNTICPDGTNSNNDGGTCLGHGV